MLTDFVFDLCMGGKTSRIQSLTRVLSSTCTRVGFTRLNRTLREHTARSFVAIVIHTLQIWASLKFLGTSKSGHDSVVLRLYDTAQFQVLRNSFFSMVQHRHRGKVNIFYYLNVKSIVCYSMFRHK